MPIRIPDKLPAKEILRRENIFVMDESRAYRQDIRALEIAILNLMPLKEETEVQLLRLLGNTALQVNITFLHMASHVSKNTKADHLSAFYHIFPEVADRRFDGMIITGAPVEHMPFEAVTYWDELCEIMSWSMTNVTSVLHICWGAQAALYFHYSIPKYPLPEKMFGIFKHSKSDIEADILRGFDDHFYVPQSRHTEIRRTDIDKNPNLIILSESEEAGIHLLASTDCRRHIFATGHSEYDPLTLKNEFTRDQARGQSISPPKNYFPNNNTNATPTVNWRSHANLLFSNWLNYCVYQETPYRL